VVGKARNRAIHAPQSVDVRKFSARNHRERGVSRTPI